MTKKEQVALTIASMPYREMMDLVDEWSDWTRVDSFEGLDPSRPVVGEDLFARLLSDWAYNNSPVPIDN
jgi:hypothetical protein